MTPALTPEAWAQIRYAYEHSDRPIHDICAEYRISTGTLRDRMRRWDWTRRREPIPREGPPAMMPPVEMTLDALTPTPAPSPQAGGSASAEIATPQSDIEAPNAQPLDPRFRGDERRNEPPADTDPAAIVPRLQGAVARVLPAIEATLAKLAAGPLRPREMEQTARALGALTRTLRELNALLKEHPESARDNDDPVPGDIDEFRYELARRIRAFIKARQAKREAAEAEDDAAGPGESEDPGADGSEQAAAGVPLART